MAGSTLEQHLSTVAGRMHRLRVLRRQAACWLIVLLPAVVLCLLLPPTGLPLRRESLALIIAGLIGILLARWQQRVPSWLETARLVEQHNPSLNDVVLTAVKHRSSESQVSSVLSARVLREADNAAAVSDWRSIASGREIFTWFAISLASFSLLVSSVLGASRLSKLGVLSAPASLDGGPADASSATTAVTVEPGDAEIERGAALTVVAHFAGGMPSHAVVEFQPDPLDTQDDVETPDAVAVSTPAVRRVPMDETVDAKVFAVRLPAIDRDGHYSVIYGNSESDLADRRLESPSYRIRTFERPRVVQVDARIVPPDWTGQKPSAIEDTLRIVAIERSAVTLSLHVNKEVTHSELIAADGSRVGLQPGSQPLTLTADIDATDDSSWAVELEDADRRTASEPTRISLRVIRNEPPAIRITFPAPDNSVSALQEVLTEADAVDDFGIVNYGIVYALSGGLPQTVSLNPGNAPVEKAAMSHRIDLEKLHAAPHDLLTWHFYADTYNANGEIQRTLSDLMFADVRRFEEIFRESQQQSGQSQQQQQQQSGNSTDTLLQIQRQIAIALWNVQRSVTVNPDDPAAEGSVRTISDSQEVALDQLAEAKEEASGKAEVIVAMDEAAESMRDVLDALGQYSQPAPEPALSNASAAAQTAFQRLLVLRAAEHEVQRSRNQSQGQSSGQQNSAMQQQLDQLELDNERNRYETEKQAQQTQQSEEQNEQLQVLSRLKELARRQNLLNERLKQLESELRNAKTEEEKERIERELKRLRDEQRELLRDVDELDERMEQSSQRNSPEQQKMRQQAEEARENVRQASRAMDEGRLSEALTEGRRAERQFDQLQEEFRQQTSSAFSEAARDLRQQARELSERQDEIARRLNGEPPEKKDRDEEFGKEDSGSDRPNRDQPDGEATANDGRSNKPPTARNERRSLRSGRDDDAIKEQLAQQRDALERVLEQSRKLVEQAEDSEPLLAQKLFDTVDRVDRMRPAEALQAAELLVDRGLWTQAEEPEEAARRAIRSLKTGVEEAAEAVLGSEAEALRRAKDTLEDLSGELSEEVEAAKGESAESLRIADEGRPDARQSDGGYRDQEQDRGQERGDSGERSPSENTARNDSREQQNQDGTPQQSSQPSQPSSEQSSRPGSQQSDGRSSQPSSQQSLSNLRQGGRESSGSSAINHRPITGSDYRAWSDRMREVEELLEDPDLRQQASRVRDRARSMRAEFRRHGTEPQWELVESELLGEMQNLQKRLIQEIAAAESDRSMVPIDREPVPEAFSELVQRYYELLGQERVGRERQDSGQ